MSTPSSPLGMYGSAGRLAPRSLRQLRDWLSLAQVGIAVLAVALGGGASTIALVVASVATALAFVRPLPSETSPGVQRAWTGLIFVALVGSLARAFARVEFLDAGIDFLLLLVVQRFFNRQRTREHLQLLLLGAVLMTIASAINADLNYPVLLVIYLPTVFMGLIVNHLLGESERLGARVEHELVRRGTRDLPLLWRAVGQVAAVAGFGALVVFVLFPRFGVGAFLHGSLNRGATSGFGDQVQLGGFGRIKNDATVVMRLEPETPMPVVDRLTWHLRGNTFDQYESGRWSKGAEIEAQKISSPVRLMPMPGARAYQVFANARSPVAVRASDGTILARPRTGQSRPTPTTRMRVNLEDIGTDKLFAAEEPLAVRLLPRSPIENQNRVYGDFERQLIVPRKQPGPIQYEFVSRIEQPTASELARIGDPPVPPLIIPYLQRSTSLSPDVTALAQRITAGSNTRIEKVRKVYEWLQANFEYTLDQPQSARVANGADPLEGFLFDTKAGHCEYFATAMAVLLREAGVPTRNVNGFYGAHYNDVGEFYVVRQADAHSWVEVYFDEYGWVTFDPTPPSGRVAGDDAPFWPGLADVIEAVRNAYLSYVVGFDLKTQFAFLERLGVERKGLSLKVDWRRLGAITLGFVAFVALLRRVLRQRRVAPRPAHIEAYEQLLQRLAKAGISRAPHESAAALASRLRAEGHDVAESFSAFAAKYEGLRYAKGDPSPALVAELVRLARGVRV